MAESMMVRTSDGWDAEQIKEKIISAFQEIAALGNSGNWTGEKPWTAKIKATLNDLGKHYNFHTCASGCDSLNGSEWLCDFVWLKTDQERQVVDVPLVVESEWGDMRAVMDDFQKILIINARLKMMILQPNDIDSALTIMKNAIHAFRHTRPGDHYLFAFWSNRTWKFETYIVGD